MPGLRLRRTVTVCLCYGALNVQAAHAQTTSADKSITPELGGYVRSLTGFQDLGYSAFGADQRSLFNSEVVRLKWLLDVPGVLRVSVHNRLQTQVSTAPTQGRSALGFGVSAVPGRSIDLRTNLVTEEHVSVWHDLDRLAVTLYLDAADITVGRQAVTWGISNVFPVADLWAQFSPFELDTDEKPGLDAVRALIYPAPGVELDAVIADRGTSRNVSAGIRATVELPAADVYGAIGKFWREFMGLAGASFVFDSWKIRGEIVVPRDIDTHDWKPVRATVGADWIGAKVLLSLEYHRNGVGANRSADYPAQLVSPEFARGESYYLGKNYLGGVVAYQATDRVNISLSNLTNLGDPSVAFIPTATYDVGQNMRVSAGSLLSFGAKPVFSGTTARLDSEFGLYGDFVYTRMSMYF